MNSRASAAFERMNKLGAKRRPFLFLLDYELESPLVLTAEEIPNYGIRYQLPNGGSDYGCKSLGGEQNPEQLDPITEIHAPDPISYGRAFDLVQAEQRAGNSYLCNLTAAVPVTLRCSLEEVYEISRAKFCLVWPERFVVFSPEPFVRIAGNIISSCPMKGTINAELPDAAARILADEKESAEHTTIVDLIRNDIGRVAHHVHVPRYRYIEEIAGPRARILAVSSRIEGELSVDWQERIGDIFAELLPAGSITGAPKHSTCRIIRKAEDYRRGFYTGVVGLFDGEGLESGVLIRFIEKTQEGFVFKTGGGITMNSKTELEYQELIQKINVPFS
ncbi:MAG: aminodeoxychorismate synthase component I [Spirochaeta sp.]|nr:aminodeoxychorismate synthase component I [Spirochaeta sp.]